MKTVALTRYQWVLLHNMVTHRGPEYQELKDDYLQIALDIQDQVWK